MTRGRCAKCQKDFSPGARIKLEIGRISDSSACYIVDTLKKRFSIHLNHEGGKLTSNIGLQRLGRVLSVLKRENTWWDGIFSTNTELTCFSCKSWPADPKGWRHK